MVDNKIPKIKKKGIKTMKLKKKTIAISIISLSILVLILIILLIISIFNNSNVINAKNRLDYIYSDEWNDEKFPDGMPKFYRSYEGKLTAENIGKSIYYVVNELIPNYNNTFNGKSDNEITQFYNENKEEIALLLGINDINDFKDFINKILEINSSEQTELEEFFIDGESIKSIASYSTADLHIKYKENEEIIVKIKVLRNKSNEISSIQYSV